MGAEAYVPRLLPAWAAAEPDPTHRVVEGSLVLLDITGFTRLTERLARRGREGAEELIDILDSVFGRLLVESDDEGADLLKWGGDAVLLLLDGQAHARGASRQGRCRVRPGGFGPRRGARRRTVNCWSSGRRQPG